MSSPESALATAIRPQGILTTWRPSSEAARRRGFAAGRLATRTERDDVCRGSAFAPLVEYGRIILFLHLFLFAFAQIAGIN